MARVYNFSAGPAMLPLEILEQVKDELLDWKSIGMSVMEISHRGKDFLALAEEAENDLRELLTIPSGYKVLFLQGGARSQFAMVPLNLLKQHTTADYLDTGIWSKLACKEAERYCQVNLVASSSLNNYTDIPPPDTWQLNPEAAYFHYVDNETINGIEFDYIPLVESSVLVSDMSSNILSRPFDISRYALVYAGAQKNIGPAGLTLVILKEELIEDVPAYTPSMFTYRNHIEQHSMYNTPPTFAWYMAALNFKWLKSQGGLSVIASRNSRKSQKLYDFLDSSDFYFNPIQKPCRSRMNVVFRLKDESLNDQFLNAAADNGLANLKGHKLVGGMRASLYNAMPEKGVDCLIDFMKDFSYRFG